ncbi:MAG: hypothetical protein ACK56F_16730 [bacterium]
MPRWTSRSGRRRRGSRRWRAWWGRSGTGWPCSRRRWRSGGSATRWRSRSASGSSFRARSWRRRSGRWGRC